MHEFTLLGIFNYIIVFMFYCKTIWTVMDRFNCGIYITV